MSTVQLPDINLNKSVMTSGKGNRRGLNASVVVQNTSINKNQSSINLSTSLGQSQSLVALRSLDKYYKTNDVHDILGHEKEYYPQLPTTQKMSQVKEVDGNLSSLKKSFNFLRNKSDQREKEIQQLRDNIDKMKNTEQTLSLRFGGSEEAFGVLRQQFEETKSNQIEAEMNMKTYEHMIRRMKKDIIAYKLKAHGTEDTLELGESVLQNASLKSQAIMQKEGKAQLALDHVLKAKEEENKEREAYLENFKKALMDQNELEKQRDERIKHQQEIAEVAANDIRDLNLKKWQKLLQVHTFLNTFLKRKMESEMKKYSDVEQAFQKIKAATGVHDAGEIVQKFLNRENTYSHLLISISEYEKKIQNLRKKNEELKAEEHSLKQEIAPYEKAENKTDKLHIDEIYQKYNETSDKAENCRLVESRVYDWMLRTLMKLNRALGIPGTKDQYSKQYSISQIQVLIQKITLILKENLVSLDSTPEAEEVTVAQLKGKIDNLPAQKRVKDQSQIQRSGSKDSFEKPSVSFDASHQSDGEAFESEADVDIEKEEEENVNQMRKLAKYEAKHSNNSNNKSFAMKIATPQSAGK